MVLGWTALALLSCGQSYLFALASSTETVFTWASVLPRVAIETANGVALTLAALHLSGRTPIGCKNTAGAVIGTPIAVAVGRGTAGVGQGLEVVGRGEPRRLVGHRRTGEGQGKRGEGGQ